MTTTLYIQAQRQPLTLNSLFFSSLRTVDKGFRFHNQTKHINYTATYDDIKLMLVVVLFSLLLFLVFPIPSLTFFGAVCSSCLKFKAYYFQCSYISYFIQNTMSESSLYGWMCVCACVRIHIIIISIILYTFLRLAFWKKRISKRHTHCTAHRGNTRSLGYFTITPITNHYIRNSIQPFCFCVFTHY